MKISTVLYVPSPYPARGKMVFPQHWRSSSNGVFICVQPIARLKFVADLTDEKDSNPLVVGVVQLFTIMVSFAAMTLVRGKYILFLKI